MWEPFKFWASFPFFLLFIVGTASSQQSLDEYKKLAGSYVWSTGFNAETIQLNDDGTYWRQYFTDCCEHYPKVAGKYAVSGNTVNFQPDRKEESLDVFGNSFSIQWMRWGNRIYLIEPERFTAFAAAVNFGEEPREKLIHRGHPFFLRRGDEAAVVTGLPEVPEAIKALISAPLIEAAISDSKVLDERMVVDVDKGSDHGVLRGMCFVLKVDTDYWDELFCASAVAKYTAVLHGSKKWRASPFKRGAILINRSVSPLLK